VLDAGVAVVDGNLGSQGPVYATDRRRSLVLLNPRCSALIQAQFQRGKVLLPLSSRPQLGELDQFSRIEAASMCGSTHS
jgi:hypothetical protein